MNALNRSLFEWLFAFAHVNALMDEGVVFFARLLPYLAAGGVLIFIFSLNGWRKRIFLLLEIALALILSRGLLTELIRFFFPYERPNEAYGIAALLRESSSSFPSGHAVVFFALAMTLIVYSRRWGIAYFFLALGISAARVMAGVHWPLDIIGGLFIGAGGASMIHLLLKPASHALFRTHTGARGAQATTPSQNSLSPVEKEIPGDKNTDNSNHNESRDQ